MTGADADHKAGLSASTVPELSDVNLLKMAEAPVPWDPERFQVLAQLQKAPRNRGEVLLVEDHKRFGKRLAVKRMPVDWTGQDVFEFAGTHPGESEVPWMDMGVTRWLNMKRFKHCVEYAGVYQDGDYLAFLMGFAEGGDLFSFLDAMQLSGSSLETENLLRPLVVELLEAVASLHLLGLAHRDLSLENVLLQQRTTGPLCLIDFSMATCSKKISGSSCGKPSYLAPEVHEGDTYSAFEADAFACGVIIYAMILKDYPWMSTKKGGCKCFEYVREHGFLAFIRRRRIMIRGERRLVVEVLSPGLALLLDGLLQVDPATRLSLKRPEDVGREKSVWSQSWVLGRPQPTKEPKRPCGVEASISNRGLAIFAT